MATSEIEKLERRYAENPHGLTFAPLAEVHRKNGDVARALELLTAGLELHPNYIPASIVLGRCHQDLGDLPAAEAAFAHVLRLDDENVIALKSLADINEQLERFDDAENWLRRLVSVDRSNEEAREQLRRVEAAKNGGPAPAVSASATTDESVDRPKRPSAEVVALDLPPIDIAALDLAERTRELAVEPTPEPATPPAEAQPEEDVPVPEEVPVASQPREAAPLVFERRAELSEEMVPEVPSITDTPAPAVAGSVEPMPGLESQEFEAPREPVGSRPQALGIDVETSQEVELQGSGGSEYRVPDAAEEFRETVAGPPPTRVPEPVPQSHEPSGKPSYRARDTQGQSVAAFFRTMLAARPPTGAGSSNRPAQDGLSLSTVIGEAGAEPKPAAGVTFDDFFGSNREGSSDEKGTDPGHDDLDQFHSWLQNLKR